MKRGTAWAVCWIACTHAALTPPPSWSFLSRTAKASARDWFVRRAETRGIPWSDLTRAHQDRLGDYQRRFRRLARRNVAIPAYYNQPFHGYDRGNLNWDAACEMDASTFSMTSNYWPAVAYEDAAAYVRGNFTEAIRMYRIDEAPRRILDVGCSTGVSMAHARTAFPAARLTGLDLSPYFLALADARHEEDAKVRLVHGNAERMPLADASFDLVTISYVLHEVPPEAMRRILDECHRVLKPMGTVAIVDLDPGRLRDRLTNPFRKWAFEATEPHVWKYYDSCLAEALRDVGFQDVVDAPNDPINRVWLGTRE